MNPEIETASPSAGRNGGYDSDATINRATETTSE